MASTKSEGLTINEKSGSVGEHTSHSLSSGAMQALPASGADGDPEASVVIFTKQKEKQILRKMDLRLIPILSALYLMSFIDRTNVGNAKIEGLMDDLNLTSQQFNWCCEWHSPSTFG